MPTHRRPGEYVVENSALPTSVIIEPTAAPAFIGYTEKAVDNGQSLHNTPVEVSSFSQFERMFGGKHSGGSGFIFHESLNYFWENGGASCYIVSVGDYTGSPSKDDLKGGLVQLETEPAPTMVVIPEATKLASAKDCYELQREMLKHCAENKFRIALLDIYAEDLPNHIENFRKAIGTQNLDFGAAYYPALKTKDGHQLPPCSAIAGLINKVDQQQGFWRAPANVVLQSTKEPTIEIDDTAQEDLNQPLDGKSVNAIRKFEELGTLVWGARTLDGSNLDCRYVNVKRATIIIEKSLHNALKAYVFEPNNSTTWENIKAMSTSFLNDLWREGALAGATPEDAFDVEIGLNTTMTAADISNKHLILEVRLALSRPAEFTVIRLQQKML